MANPFTVSPGVEQGDVGARFTRKRLQDEIYKAHYIKAGDQIRVNVFLATGVAAAVTTVTIFVGGRVQGLDGELVQFGDTFLYTADGAGTPRYFMAPEGYVVDLIVTTSTAALGALDVAVTVDIVQGTGSSAQPVGFLTAGYIGLARSLGLA